MDINKNLEVGKNVTINVPFTYTIGEEAPVSGRVLNTFKNCMDEVKVELLNGVDTDNLLVEIAPSPLNVSGLVDVLKHMTKDILKKASFTFFTDEDFENNEDVVADMTLITNISIKGTVDKYSVQKVEGGKLFVRGVGETNSKQRPLYISDMKFEEAVEVVRHIEYFERIK